MNDTEIMRKAIELSRLAMEHGNEPFGAVLAKDGEIVCTSENQIHTMKDPTMHAELGLLQQFCRQTGIRDLREYTLYASCEPCFMCSGAIVWTKTGRLVYAASSRDLAEVRGKHGDCPSRITFLHSGWRPAVTADILREEAVDVLRAYWKGGE